MVGVEPLPRGTTLHTKLEMYKFTIKKNTRFVECDKLYQKITLKLNMVSYLWNSGRKVLRMRILL